MGMCYRHPYALHAQSPCVDQFRDFYHHYPYCAHNACSNCQSSDHDVNSCPYYVISDEGFVRLNDVIETLNEQNAKFESYCKRITYYMRPTLAYLLLDLRLVCVMMQVFVSPRI